jgi:chemotaxis protein MotB
MKPLHITATTLLLVIMTLSTQPMRAESKKLKKAKKQITALEASKRTVEERLSDCGDSLQKYRLVVASLANKLEIQSNNNAMLTNQLQQQKASSDEVIKHLKDLSMLTNSQAESINKFLQTLGAKDAYINDLQNAMARKDSLNMALVMNLKGALGNMDDKDINVKVDKGVVYIDISDKMLFKSGKYEVTPRAKDVLGKVAKVLLARPEIEFMVEGHTDNVAYRDGQLLDNWDLSVKRATSVVRMLQTEYAIPAERMTAAGRGEYKPLAPNTDTEGKAANRRTRIVILPQLDQFFQLLEQPKSKE